ncbi:MAG: NAD(P)(+) transhydrogenase (Si-specific) [Candidatus Dactylopiibacterium carminicum]|uniref:Soluble pyridine nucleotide transhydrogenase n=1 Tax=Candidatus Dactylopiibacterium carminicum TaxID=857335 RepID=A0A272EU55_9RHOO|nr:Si-specific NAD(P)(+) transhydrogenase [Candidatus Dactylopiibacterium carminicum]KAF7599687.1 Si-specific NAD(P)(+) transhydrogenase [Candidatus Dactylopiibacterium carminicum]PAS93623.1 MAG: NAD(P)(+) transhydrogenase (Si-specific) [Candidatus Dactylopiibacterium carminicum]PAS97491.1 MAG: NAD(P)(+) transhydrogenase (Si-specific) [Candidatus Dactylopiibacterium carminicum]PAS99689.1 MAG: NAD(P)(+) transhydrogenase [Candidatus Dactylopiibacterium carminicum]
MQQFDVVVIGSGPGGEGAAMKCAKSGKSVAMVEAYEFVGGGCTHWGTIPSKALRQVISGLREIRENPQFHDAMEMGISFPALLRTAESVIRKQVVMRQSFYDRNTVQVIHGRARFCDANTLEVALHNGGQEILRAHQFVIATGSRPYHPPEIDFTHPRVHDSDSILRLNESPESITIYGAGVIGCEYASIFRNLGCKVNLINTRDRLLSFLDDEIVDALAYHLREQGVLVRHNEEAARVIPQEDGVVLELKSNKRIKTDYLLWANGRQGNTDDMGLESLGIQPDKRGVIAVNENYQTALPHIYGVGDVIGWPSLASAAYDQGRHAAAHLVDGVYQSELAREIPTGIYTLPEISSLNKTERELTEAKVPYEVGHSLFRSLARAQIAGQTTGMLKLLFHRDTLEVLGIHCFGAQASEIIHIGQAIMMQPAPNNTITYFVNTTFNYPTMAEAYRVAALNGLNRLC